jgi:hypothetical protein
MSISHASSLHLLFSLLALTACSASSKNEAPGNPDLGGDTGLAMDSGLHDASDEATVDTGDPFTLPDVSMETGLSPDAGCATATAAAIKKPVDIIVIIDQSGSMDEESVQVQNNINKLSTYLAATGLDYRVVMIAGKPGNGSLPMCVPTPLAGPSCASKPPRFRAVNQHIESWDSLKLILSTFDSTATDTKWSDFLRFDAVKVFIPITDDDATDSAIAAPVSTNFDVALLSRGKGTFGTKSKRKYVFYPICGVSTASTTTKCSTAVNTGPTYVDLATITKGKPFSVCETNYEPVFKAIGKAIATSVACEITIPPPPTGETFDPDKVNVVYKDSGGGSTTIPQDTTAGCLEGANGWQYDDTKTKVLLCGDACTNAKADPGAIIDVEFGCSTTVIVK